MKKFLAFAIMVVFFAATVTTNTATGKEKTKTVKVEKNKKYKVNLDNGKKVYDKICFACHKTGVAGAAALTDKKRWEENAALGLDKLFSLAIKGNPKGNYGVMPAKGGCTDCSENDIKDAVSYMLKEAGVKTKNK